MAGFPSSPDPSSSSVTSGATSNLTRSSLPASDLDVSERSYGPIMGDSEKARRKEKRSSRAKWLTQVKDWLSTSEPTAQAMKEQKRSTYAEHGVALDDPRAAAKMHFPMGKVPEDAITSTSGPTPEDALKHRAAQYRTRESLGAGASRAGSSGSSLRPSLKEKIAPWES